MTTRLTVVVADSAPLAAFTVADVVPAAISGRVATVIVVVPLPVTVVGLKLHVAPAGSPVQLKFTIPLNPFVDATVIVVVTLAPAATLVGFKADADTANEVNAAARLFRSIEPRPVTRL